VQIKEKARNPIKDLAATARYWTLDRPTSQQTKTTAERDGLACAFGRMTCCGRACLRFCAFCGPRQSRCYSYRRPLRIARGRRHQPSPHLFLWRQLSSKFADASSSRSRSQSIQQDAGAQTPASLIKPTNWYARVVLKYQTSVLKRRKLRTSEKLARFIRYEALLTNASPVPKCGEKPGSFCGTRSNLLGCPSIRTQTHLLPLFAAPATTSTARQLANGRERCDVLLVQKGQRPGSRPL
jgi:hypothetical protein